MKHKYFVSYLLCVNVIIINISPIRAACSESQFECNNGNCISRYDVCNGNKNCPDGSDETALMCIPQREYCSPAFFLCSYGACVSGTAGCNNVEDCADGSDETVLRCGSEDDVREFDRRLKGNCQDNELKCPSGICIDKSTSVCDGHDDCGDGYDETVILCGHLECPGYAFKCGSGGCISKNVMCNGVNDCYDGSDEGPLLCNTTNTVPLQTGSTTPLPQLGCPLPLGDERPILRDRSNYTIHPPILRGIVYFSCKPGYFLEGYSSSTCAQSQWSVPKVPKCKKYCAVKSLLDGYSTNVTCISEGQSKDCTKPFHPPGTVLKFECANGFQLDQTTAHLPDVTCMPNGKWDRAPGQCVQECGQIATPVKPFSAYGYSTNNTEVPWHVGLYAWHNEKHYKFVCGGTLLTPDLVITAGHCVYDEAAGHAYSIETFKVIAAKFYRDYRRETPEEVKRGVQDIKVARGYKGRDNNYFNDLALLVLDERYKLNNVIRPICINFQYYANKESINNDVSGKFAAWNFEDENELQFVPAKSKMNSECSSTYIRDLPSDKFCMFTEGKSLACRGDSGGGFTAMRRTDIFSNDNYRHFLYGVISNAPNADQCAHGVTVLTNIQHFEDMILKAITKSRNNYLMSIDV